MIGWMPHSTNPVYAGVRFRCFYPMRTLNDLSINCELYDVTHIDRYTTVVIQELLCFPDDKKPYPTGDGIVEEMKHLKAKGVKLIIDTCDNHLYQPFPNEKWQAAKKHFNEMLQLADHLVFSTETVSNEIQKNIPVKLPISIIGDAIETQEDLYSVPLWRRMLSKYYYIDNYSAYELRQQLKRTSKAGGMKLVWFGSHGSSIASGGMTSIQTLRDLLHRLSKDVRPLSLTVISNHRTKYEQITSDWKIPTYYCDWSRPTFYRLLKMHDICVIPIERNSFTLCKTNNRLVTAIACGLAVVADSIPSYLEFKDCCSLDDWEHGLSNYLSDDELRRIDVTAGQTLIEKNWSHENIGQLWADVLQQSA